MLIPESRPRSSSFPPLSQYAAPELASWWRGSPVLPSVEVWSWLGRLDEDSMEIWSVNSTWISQRSTGAGERGTKETGSSTDALMEEIWVSVVCKRGNKQCKNKNKSYRRLGLILSGWWSSSWSSQTYSEKWNKEQRSQRDSQTQHRQRPWGENTNTQVKPSLLNKTTTNAASFHTQSKQDESTARLQNEIGRD